MKMKSLPSIIPFALFAICSASNAQPADELVYNGEIGRLINENCVVCHQEGGIGPMQFETYEQVRPWAPLIQYKVANREMPPYAYDEHIGIQDLIGDWRLDQDEIDKIVAWAENGAPLGDPERALPPADLRDPDEWNFARELGQPDLVIPSVPVDIPANGNDLWHNHIVATGLSEDRCIRAIQVKPRGDAHAVVHHANSSVVTINEQGEIAGEGMLTEYAMGKWGEIVPDGVCRTLPGDSNIRWSIHMFPGGVGATAQGEMIEDNVVEIGLWFHEPGYEASGDIYRQDLAQYHIQYDSARHRDVSMAIPPNGYFMTQGFHSFDHPVRLDSFQPHGHLRMNAASLEIFYPETGRTEQVSQISNWSATWHHNHIYEPDSAPLIPAGAVLILKQWYDNTAENPNNPDPDQWVYGGQRTGDEMSHAWLAVTHLDQDGYEKLVAERESGLRQSVVGNN
jgi:mono/diheme cytochrome c family protein